MGNNTIQNTKIYGFPNKLCTECAENFVLAFRNAGVNGKVIRLVKRSPRGNNVWNDKVRKNVGETGFHEAVEIDGFVFDNINPQGIAKSEWIRQFDAIDGLVEKVVGKF